MLTLSIKRRWLSSHRMQHEFFRSFHNTYLHNRASQYFWIFEGIGPLHCEGSNLMNKNSERRRCWPVSDGILVRMIRTFKTVDYDRALDLTVRLGDYCLPSCSISCVCIPSSFVSWIGYQPTAGAVTGPSNFQSNVPSLVLRAYKPLLPPAKITSSITTGLAPINPAVWYCQSIDPSLARKA